MNSRSVTDRPETTPATTGQPGPQKQQSGDAAYLNWLKEDYTRLINALALSDLHKHMLKSRWLDQVLWMEGRANRTRDWYYRLRLTTIIGGILIPILVTLSQTAALPWVAWVATFIGALVAIAAAVEEFFRYGERWRHYRNTVETLKIEGWYFFQLSGPYSRYNTHEQAYERFGGRVEAILQQDVQTYITKVVVEEEPLKGEQENP